MSFPKIVYNAGGGNVTLSFARPPQDFTSYAAPVVHDNIATSGQKERLLEYRHQFIAFTMPYLRVPGDLIEWGAFMDWALGGGEFDFYPDAALATFFTCTVEGDRFEPRRNAPGQYSADFLFRIVPGATEPADPTVVMKRYYGIAV